MALAVTSDSFSDDDCANRILPALCPCLVDKEKLVRDQGNKTLDAYLQRIRKSASSLPDTVLPPPSTGEAATASAPRMGTPQPSEAASWTGWAISSFTNKVSAATGDIQPTASSAAATRPTSAPITNDSRRPNPATASASTLHRQAVASPPTASTRTSLSSNANDYFQDSNTGQEDTDAWGDMEEDSFFDAPSDTTPKSASKSSAANPFDNGEPDFAGWLAAQAAKKPGVQKALPKGLAKAAVVSNGRPASAGRIATTGSLGGSGAKKATVAAMKPQAKPAVAKKINTAPKVTDDDDGWGDGW